MVSDDVVVTSAQAIRGLGDTLPDVDQSADIDTLGRHVDHFHELHAVLRDALTDIDTA